MKRPCLPRNWPKVFASSPGIRKSSKPCWLPAAKVATTKNAGGREASRAFFFAWFLAQCSVLTAFQGIDQVVELFPIGLVQAHHNAVRFQHFSFHHFFRLILRRQV